MDPKLGQAEDPPVTDSANNPLAQGADQAPAGLDDLLASVISDESKISSKNADIVVMITKAKKMAR